MKKPSAVYQKLAANIRNSRVHLKMTQEKLAGEAQLNRAYIGYIERGERKPSVETLEKIAHALQIDLHRLFIFK